MEPISKARSGHWRVFAARPFEANELVEVQGVMWEMMHPKKGVISILVVWRSKRTLLYRVNPLFFGGFLGHGS